MSKGIFTKEIVLAIWIISMSWVLSNDAFAHSLTQTDDSNTSMETAKNLFQIQPSKIIYEDLAMNEKKYYQFMGVKGEQLQLEIVVPKIDRLVSFSPALMLVGEGFDPLSISSFNEKGENLGRISKTSLRGTFDLPPEVGGFIVEYKGVIPSNSFFETFGNANWYERQKISIPIPQTGEFFIIIFDQNGQAGKYALSVGAEEIFELEDISFGLPFAFVQTQIFVEDEIKLFLYSLVFYGSIILIMLYIFYFRRR